MRIFDIFLCAFILFLFPQKVKICWRYEFDEERWKTEKMKNFRVQEMAYILRHYHHGAMAGMLMVKETRKCEHLTRYSFIKGSDGRFNSIHNRLVLLNERGCRGLGWLLLPGAIIHYTILFGSFRLVNIGILER